jgi:hypothetical protein
MSEPMQQMTPAEFCKKNGACMDGRRFAMKYKTMAEAWDACDEISWLIWTLVHTGTSKEQEISARKFVLRIMRDTPLPDGHKLWDMLSRECREALRVAEYYIDGRATFIQLDKQKNLISADKYEWHKNWFHYEIDAIECIIQGSFSTASDTTSNIVRRIYEKYRDYKGVRCAEAFFTKVLKEVLPNPFIKTEGGAA